MAIFCFADTVMLTHDRPVCPGLGQAFSLLSAYYDGRRPGGSAGPRRDFGSIDESANRWALIGTARFCVMFVLMRPASP
jgi:hypothetical protein